MGPMGNGLSHSGRGRAGGGGHLARILDQREPPRGPPAVTAYLPLLMRCFSPDRIPGVSMMLMLSKTGLGSWAHMNLHKGQRREERSQDSVIAALRAQQCFLCAWPPLPPFQGQGA